jgi:hypothetical protein
MGTPSLVQCLASQKAAGTLFNTFTTAKSVLNTTELVQFPANYLQQGSKLRIRVMGGLSNIVTTPGTVAFQVMMGSIIVWSSGNLQMTTTANTLTPIELEINLRLDSAGSGTAAKFMATGKLVALDATIGSGANPTVTDTAVVLPVTAPAVGTGFDSTIADILDFWVGFSISNAGNGFQIYDYTVELLNAPT